MTTGFSRTVRFMANKNSDQSEDDESDGFVDLGQVTDYTACGAPGEKLFCRK